MYQLMSIFENCCKNGIYLGPIVGTMKGLFDIVGFVVIFVCLCLSGYNLVMAHLEKTNKLKKQLLFETFRYIVIALIIIITIAIFKSLMGTQYNDYEQVQCWCHNETSFEFSKDVGILSLIVLLYVVPTVLFIVGTFKAVLNYGKKTIESKIKFKRGIRFYLYSIVLFTIGIILLGMIN